MELLRNLITLLEANNNLLETYCMRFNDHIPQEELLNTQAGIELTKEILSDLKKDAFNQRLKSEGRQN